MASACEGAGAERVSADRRHEDLREFLDRAARMGEVRRNFALTLFIPMQASRVMR